MAVSQQVTSRDRAIFLMTRFFGYFTPRAEWRHTDVEEVVDALLDALEDRRTKEEKRS